MCLIVVLNLLSQPNKPNSSFYCSSNYRVKYYWSDCEVIKKIVDSELKD